MTQPTSDQPPTSPATPAAVASKTSPQAGILNRPPEHLLLVALSIVGSDARDAVERLRTVVQAELTSALDPLGPPDQPPGETGEIGFDPHHDRAHLTITVGFSANAFDKLKVETAERPADLRPIAWQELKDQPPAVDSGDLLLQICADSTYIAEHVLRRIESHLAGQLQVVWVHAGAQRYNSRAGRTARHEGRAWIGFLDGTSNLEPKKNPDDYALTFIDPDPAVVSKYPKNPPPGQAGGQYGNNNQPKFPPGLHEHPGHEPEWTQHGSYLVARVSVNDLGKWDGQTLTAQEQAIGRTKVTGVSLDLADQEDARPETPPAFATNQSLATVPLDSHIRKANPRGGADDSARRIFRRGYPLYEAAGEALRRGLVFLCYARTISTQFEFITRAWLTNPDFPHPGAGVDRLKAFDTQVLAGGYYFVPPLDDHRHPWTWHVPPAGAS